MSEPMLSERWRKLFDGANPKSIIGGFPYPEWGDEISALEERIEEFDTKWDQLRKMYDARLGELEAAREALTEAIPFVEMAGAADNSGEEYGPLCQECTSIMTDHKADCELNAWLERNK